MMRHSRTKNLVIRRYLRMSDMADTLSCYWQGEVRLGCRARNVSLAGRVDKVQDSSAHARTDGSSTTRKRTMTLNCLRLLILIIYFHSSLQSWVEFRKYTVLWHVIRDWYPSVLNIRFNRTFILVILIFQSTLAPLLRTCKYSPSLKFSSLHMRFKLLLFLNHMKFLFLGAANC